MALSALLCLGRCTITGLLSASGQQFVDWSSAYRLFQHKRFDLEGLFAPARGEVLQRLPKDEPVVAMMDDTIISKTGRKVYGAGWRRDPMGPKFQTNLIWGQRFIQLSAALPQGKQPCCARAIPIDLVHAPTAKKPGTRATEQQRKQYRKACKQMNMSKVGSERIILLRRSLDKDPGGRQRQLIISVDGSYTNKTVIKSLPERTTLIGRIRKDAKLYHLPDQQQGVGRRRVYGQQAPTPEQIRQDQSTPWITVKAFAAGKTHDFQVKTMGPIRWRGLGERNFRLVVIRPLRYRLTKNGPALYRKPAYLLCTDLELPLEKLLQYYLWRWEIELNFRDEKTLLGLGQAQVRNQNAVIQVPGLLVAAYAYLLLAAERNQKQIPLPKWRQKEKQQRITTAQAITLLRTQMWGKAMGVDNLNHFVNKNQKHKSQFNIKNACASAVCYANK